VQSLTGKSQKVSDTTPSWRRLHKNSDQSARHARRKNWLPLESAGWTLAKARGLTITFFMVNT
jgi:hypothetical protein